MKKSTQNKLQYHLIEVSKIIKKPTKMLILPIDQHKDNVIVWMSSDGSRLPSNPHGLSYRGGPDGKGAGQRVGE